MNAIFKACKTSRGIFAEYFSNYSLDQLNKVPDGFSNNLIWNIGHIIVAQQALIYKGLNLEWNISDHLFELYRNGTRPSDYAPISHVNELKTLLTSLIVQTETDFNTGKFEGRPYTARMTGTGFYLESLEDAFLFNNYHEGLHRGVMMNIRKFV